MQKVRNNAIYAIRGDTLIFQIDLTKDDGTKYTPGEKDTMVMTVKKSTADKESVISKTAIKGVIKILPAETEGLAYGTYVYDIQLTTEDGTVDTVVPPHPFVLKEEVTF